MDTLGVPPKPWVHVAFFLFILMTGTQLSPSRSFPLGFSIGLLIPSDSFGVVRCLTSPSSFECKRSLERAEFSTKEKVVVESLKFYLYAPWD